MKNSKLRKTKVDEFDICPKCKPSMSLFIPKWKKVVCTGCGSRFQAFDKIVKIGPFV